MFAGLLHTVVRSVSWVLLCAFVLFFVLISALCVFQRNLIFPRPRKENACEIVHGRLISLDLSGEARPAGVAETIVAVYFAPATEAEWTLAFWHGNADQLGNVADSLGAALNRQHGLGFLGIEYPGYALCDGEPTEASMLWSAERFLRHLTLPRAQGGLGCRSQRVCAFGQSIGTSVALQMAARGLAARCVLLSAFCSIPRMCSALFPFVPMPERFVLDAFDSAAVAASVTVPTLLLHGTRDEIVPFEQGKELASLVPGARFVEMPNAGHNDTFAGANYATLIKTILGFLESA